MSLDQLYLDYGTTRDDVFAVEARRAAGIKEHFEKNLKEYEKKHKGEWVLIDEWLNVKFYKTKKGADKAEEELVGRPYLIAQI